MSEMPFVCHSRSHSQKKETREIRRKTAIYDYIYIYVSSNQQLSILLPQRNCRSCFQFGSVPLLSYKKLDIPDCTTGRSNETSEAFRKSVHEGRSGREGSEGALKEFESKTFSIYFWWVSRLHDVDTELKIHKFRVVLDLRKFHIFQDLPNHAVQLFFHPGICMEHCGGVKKYPACITSHGDPNCGAYKKNSIAWLSISSHIFRPQVSWMVSLDW